MNDHFEEIEIDIDSGLLEKVRIIAERNGVSASQYISAILSDYIEKTALPHGVSF